MITIDVKTLLICLLLIAITVLVVFLVVAAAHLIKTLKSLTKVLSDVEVVSDIAAERTRQVDGIVDDVTTTISGVTNKLKGDQGILKAISIIASAIIAIKNILFKSSDNNETTQKQEKSK